MLKVNVKKEMQRNVEATESVCEILRGEKKARKNDDIICYSGSGWYSSKGVIVPYVQPTEDTEQSL